MQIDMRLIPSEGSTTITVTVLLLRSLSRPSQALDMHHSFSPMLAALTLPSTVSLWRISDRPESPSMLVLSLR
jgi:hypothetical protein